MKLFVSVLLLPLLALTSCYYSQPSQDSPHAVVDFQQGTGFLNLNGINFVVMSLNGRKPENWVPGNNADERYRVVPGETDIATYVYGSEAKRRGATVLQFVAKRDKTYDITAEERADFFDVKVTERDGKSILTKKVRKIGYTTSPPAIYIPAPAN